MPVPLQLGQHSIAPFLPPQPDDRARIKQLYFQKKIEGQNTFGTSEITNV